jgi:type III pantothenate kinase
VNETALTALLAGAGAGARVLGRDLPMRMENRYRDPTETGHDRLAAAAAAHALAEGPAVVVDLGSAVTVDAVDASGAFLGGAIGPGRPALVAGLRAAAPALPDAGEMPDGLPRSTGEAIRAGIDLGLAGIVTRLVSEARSALSGGDEPVVFLTGGDAETLADRLPFPVRVDPWLVLRGVRILYDRADP